MSAGGGVALLNATETVAKLVETVEGDEKTGARIVLKALEEPVRQIAANGGLEGSVIIDTIRRSGKVGYGFDAYNEAYCDMIPAGIVDPTRGDPLCSAERCLHRGNGTDHRESGCRQEGADPSCTSHG